MAANWTLYGIWLSGPTYKVALALSLAGEAFDFVHTTPRGDAKLPAYISNINGFGQVPALTDTRSGQTYRQSPSILEVIADATGKLGGKTALERVRMREWMYWDLDRLALPIYRMRGQRIGVRMMGQSTAEMLFAEGNVALKVLDDHLAGRDWMVGDAVSIADVDIYGVLDFAAAGGFATDDFPAVAAFMTRVQALPGFGFPAGLIPKASRVV